MLLIWLRIWGVLEVSYMDVVFDVDIAIAVAVAVAAAADVNVGVNGSMLAMAAKSV